MAGKKWWKDISLTLLIYLETNKYVYKILLAEMNEDIVSWKQVPSCRVIYI